MKMSMEEPSSMGASPPPSLTTTDSDLTGSRNTRSLHAIKCYPNGTSGGGGGGGGLSFGSNGGYSNGVNWPNYNSRQPTQMSSSSTKDQHHWSPPPPSSASSSITYSRVKQLSSCFQQQQSERSPHRSHSDRSGRKMLKLPTPSSLRTPASGVGPSEMAHVNGEMSMTGLYRSNSSLDLDGTLDVGTSAEDRMCGLLRREYGSASSIDVMSTSGESFFAMLRNFGEDTRNNVINYPQDQRSPGPAHIAEYLRGKIEPLPLSQNASNTLCTASSLSSIDRQSNSEEQVLLTTTSPKSKSKFSRRLWDSSKDKSKTKSSGGGGANSEPSLFRKLRGIKNNDVQGSGSSLTESTDSRGSDNSLDNAEARYEDKLRRKCFGHYDVQSISANLSFATTRLKNVLGRRRNTTTGASAASMSNRGSSNNGTPESNSEEFNSTEDNLGSLGSNNSNCSSGGDTGDGHANDLVQSCPYFRNELGGEGERVVGLTRMADLYRTRYNSSSNGDDLLKNHTSCDRNVFLHRPSMACGLSIVERAEEGHWKSRICPYQKHTFQRENFDHGAFYFKTYFLKQEHQNWFGIDDNLGPVAVSIRRVKVDESSSSSNSPHQYRLIIRTSELSTLRGTVLEEAIPTLKQSGGRGSIRAREVLEYVAPELQLSCLRLGTAGTQTEEQLLKLDQQATTNHYKVGVLYCRGGQSTEEEMYNNEFGGPALEEFLDLIGQRVRLKGFDKYRAQLDNKTDSTGLYSVYSTFQECEVMFHVSTLLPYTANNRQQLLRKRHIGNDIVTIIFQDPDAHSFTPKNIRSHFQHVFIVVRAINPCTDSTRYSVAVSRSKDVPVFGPPIPENATFSKSRAFADFLLAKVINAENAAHQSEKFATMATRTKQEYLKDLATNHVTTTTIDTGPKFPILSFGGKKKERSRPRFIPDAYVRGAIVWQVQVDDYGQATVIDCYLGISGDTMVLIEENSKEVVFACPCTAILGWSSNTNNLRIYYHQGECIVLRTKDQNPDEVQEIQEIVSRLSCVTQGCEVQEFTLRRNNLGQLGFHVQQDGLITEVEHYGFAWQASLRQNSRLVEICKIVVSTLTYDQMVDILKTSLTVTVAVIPPNDNGSPRKGCALYSCSYLSMGHTGGDYENLNGAENAAAVLGFPGKASPKQQVAQAAVKGMKHESHSSPTKLASNVYGRKRAVNHSETRRFRTNESTSGSSQSSEEKWYDVGEMNENDVRSRGGAKNSSSADRLADMNKNETKDGQPPPLPARLNTAAVYGNQSSARRREPFISSYNNVSRGTVVSKSHEYLANAGVGYSNYVPPPINNYISSRTPETDDGKVGNYIRLGNLDQLLIEKQQGQQQQQQHHVRPLGTAQPYSVRGKPIVASPLFVGLEKHVESPLADRCVSSRSEDELSGSSSGNSLSPRGHRRRPLPLSGSNSANSSKNHSPRTVGRGLAEIGSDIKSRSNGSISRYNYSVMSNSSAGSESTFQEDLLKLINPDLIEAEEHNDPFKRPKTPPPVPLKTNSLERSIREIHGSPHRQVMSKPESPQSAEVIFTTARPATVISTTSSSSSPALSEAKLNRDERLSPRVMINVSNTASKSSSISTPNSMNSSPTILPLPDTTNDMDWTSLVDTATKAFEGVTMTTTTTNSNRMPAWVSETVSEIQEESDRLSVENCKPASFNPTGNDFGNYRIRELEIRVRMLEEELANERHRTVALEMEVQKLRDENDRLQEESQTAASQLKRFTEWFFQSIDK